MGEERFAECEEVYRILGQIVAMLKEAHQPVTDTSIRLKLHAFSSQNTDIYLARVCAAASEMMGHQ